MILEKSGIKFKFINSIERKQANVMISKVEKYLNIVLYEYDYKKYLKCVEFKVKSKDGTDGNYDFKNKTITIYNYKFLDETIYHELNHVKFDIDTLEISKCQLDEKIVNGFHFLDEYYAYYKTRLYFYNEKPDLENLKAEVERIYKERDLVFDDIEEALEIIRSITNSEYQELKDKMYDDNKKSLSIYSDKIKYFTARWLGNLSVYNQYAEIPIQITSDMNAIVNYINNIKESVTIDNCRTIGEFLE